MTVKEIARLAGVSIGTVDRVIHGRGRVSEETRAAILAIVEKSGYRPNALARHLQRGKGYVFRVLMPRTGDGSYWTLAEEGISKAREELASFGISIEILGFDRYRAGSATTAIRQALESACDGLVLAPVGTDDMRALVRTLPAGMPYVFFDAALEDTRAVCHIDQDPFRAGILAARLMSLLRPGARKLGIVNSHPGDHHLATRVAGFRAWFEGNMQPAPTVPPPPPGNGPVSLTASSSSDPAPGASVEIAEFKAESGPEGPDMVRLCTAIRQSPVMPEGLYICNANTAGFLDAWGNFGQGSRPAIIGHDLVPENRRCLSEGFMDCLISQGPEQQTRQALLVLYRHVVLGETCLNHIEAPMDIYFAENLSSNPVKTT